MITLFENKSKTSLETPITTVAVTSVYVYMRRARKPVGVEVGGPTFTQIVGGTINKKPNSAGGVKKILDRKLKNGTHNRPLQAEVRVSIYSSLSEAMKGSS